jgi:hypothetical protein
MRSLDGAQKRLSEWMLDSPVATWVITVLVLLIATSIPSSIVEEAQSTGAWVPALAVVIMLSEVVGAFVFPRLLHRPPHEVLGLLWAVSMAPVLVGLGASLLGAGRWLPGLGWLLAVASLALVLRWARRTEAEATE